MNPGGIGTLFRSGGFLDSFFLSRVTWDNYPEGVGEVREWADLESRVHDHDGGPQRTREGLGAAVFRAFPVEDVLGEDVARGWVDPPDFAHRPALIQAQEAALYGP